MNSPQKRQLRAQARRYALLRATVEVAAAKGFAGLTHRAVTEQANLPLATASYFFNSIADLGREALLVFVGEDIANLHQLASALANEHRTTDEVATAFALAAAPRWPDTAALLEAYLTAARQPEFRDTMGEALTAAHAVAAAAATAAGMPEPQEIAAGLVALAHGFALHNLALPDIVDIDDQRRAMRTMLIGHLVECGRIDEVLRITAQQ
ncbi:TetR/AcrR family transcriptional regulator [Mycobacterium montefiorense]|uniref:TetR/AcrR family transcriptional regulator n=1 Tax=Mycobacterium montefiorense TaxID=154654 RepID=UPI000D59E8B0|nr:TetR family transcriptional regulator [Mycobacterium montefiorense]